MTFFFQAEDGIRDVERSRGLGDVYKRQDIDTDLYCLSCSCDIMCSIMYFEVLDILRDLGETE